MSPIRKPNVWIDFEADPAIQLTYALQTNPSPLTVSDPKAPPHPASLQFVITNQTPNPVTVSSITFTFKIGPTGDCLTPSTDDIKTQVSDPNEWIVTGPTSTNGETADYILGPAVGSSVELDTGASVVLQFYEIQPVPQPGTTTIHIEEADQTSSASTDVSVTTFPDGFYFNGLAATVQNGSALVPVAQVVNGHIVILVWNCSVVDTAAITIRYSDATGGQQTVKPSNIGKWTSPPLTSDTIFTVSVAVTTTGGQPLTVAASTSVSVRDPGLVAGSIVAGTATVTGNATIGGTTTAKAITADSVGINGALTAQSANLSGALSAGSVAAGSVNVAGNLNITGDLTANRWANLTAAQIIGAVVSQDLRVDGQLIVNGSYGVFYCGAQVSMVSGVTLIAQGDFPMTQVFAPTDGFAVAQTLGTSDAFGQICSFNQWFQTRGANHAVTVPISSRKIWWYAGKNVQIWWFPLGVGHSSASESEEVTSRLAPPAPPPSLVDSDIGERRKDAETFVERLAHIFKAQLTDDQKIELAELLHRQ